MQLESALAAFVTLEQEARDCYIRLHQYTQGDPALSQLWFELALDEGGHAAVLQQLWELVRRIGPGPPLDFEASEIEQLRSDLRVCEHRACRPLSAGEALKIAAELEGTELDHIYQRLLRSSAMVVPELARGLEGLAESVDQHIARVERMLRERGLAREAEAVTAA